MEVQVPHLALLTNTKEGSSLLLGRGGHFGSTVELPYFFSLPGKGMGISLLLPVASTDTREKWPHYFWAVVKSPDHPLGLLWFHFSGEGKLITADGGGSADIAHDLHQLHKGDSSLLSGRDESRGPPLSFLCHHSGRHWVGCWLPPYSLARVEV